MDASGQYHAPAALTPGKNLRTHEIEVCMGPQRDNSLELPGIRTPDRADRSLVTTLYQFLKFHVNPYPANVEKMVSS